jgi:hypothetical protein
MRDISSAQAGLIHFGLLVEEEGIGYLEDAGLHDVIGENVSKAPDLVVRMLEFHLPRLAAHQLESRLVHESQYLAGCRLAALNAAHVVLSVPPVSLGHSLALPAVCVLPPCPGVRETGRDWGAGYANPRDNEGADLSYVRHLRVAL